MLIANEAISGRNVLLTGAGGSIGSALARAITTFDPSLLILLDDSERSLFEIDASLRGFRGSVDCLPVLGDISDLTLLVEMCERFKPEVILHAAALKHVPLMELNPIAAVQTNTLGTNNLAKTAAEFGVSKLVMVSTDKAVNPRSIMGASKRFAELALRRWTTERSCMRSIRLGNVLRSQGSVVTTFERQITLGGPVTVTHPDASRYFLTMEEAVELILSALNVDGQGRVLIPELGQPVKIIDLAHKVIKESGFIPETEIPIALIGLRPGDKLSENFVADNESVEQTGDPRLFAVTSLEISPDEFDLRIRELEVSVNRRDVAQTLETLRKIVPEYDPSEMILRLIRDSASIRI